MRVSILPKWIHFNSYYKKIWKGIRKEFKSTYKSPNIILSNNVNFLTQKNLTELTINITTWQNEFHISSLSLSLLYEFMYNAPSHT